MHLLIEYLEEKLSKQTIEITNAVTKNVMEAMNEKVKGLVEENKNLKIKTSELQQKVDFMEKERRMSNIVIFGVEEKERNQLELINGAKEIISKTGVQIERNEIIKAYRIGKNTDKIRPIIVSISTIWKKQLIMRNRKNLPQGIYVKEDLPKIVIERRKEQQIQLEEERKKGNIAYFNYDKLIVKTSKENNREKRKRETSYSPQTQEQSNQTSTKEIVSRAEHKKRNKTNMIDYLSSRPRSQSLTDSTPKN